MSPAPRRKKPRPDGSKLVLEPLRLPPAPSRGFDNDARAAILSALTALDETHPSFGRRSMDLLLDYVEGLPRVAASRCPLTQAEFVLPVDTGGLDGPWWDYLLPARPDEVFGPTVQAVTGAMALASQVESTDWIVRPGPGVPFVVPHLLSQDGVVAVLSEVLVGRHRGFLVVYYASTPPDGPRFNTWGREGHLVRVDGRAVETWEPELETSIDTDLSPWLESGKLHWISPGDRKLGLHTGTKGCPYLKLTGSTAFASIRYGAVH